MENTSKNNYAKTCVLNVTADVRDEIGRAHV